jgi:hypothetical protein
VQRGLLAMKDWKTFFRCCLVVVLGFAAPWCVAQSGGTTSTSIAVAGSPASGYTVTSTVTVNSGCPFGTDGFSYFITNSIGPYSNSIEADNGWEGYVATPAYPFGPGTYTANAQFPGYTGYYGDSYCYVSGSNASTTVVVPMDSITITTTPPAKPVPQGQTVTIPIVVAPSQPWLSYVQPTGSVTVFYGTEALGNVNLTPVYYQPTGNYNGGGTFTASTAGIPPGTYNLQFGYSGDSNYYPATSAPVSVTVGPPLTSTATALTVTPNPLVLGNTVQLQAVVTANSQGPAPTGTVTFATGSMTLGSAVLTTTTATSSTATFSIAANGIPAGTYPVVAKYSGDGSNKASTSSAVSVKVVEQTATTTSLSISPTTEPVVQGQTLTLTATVEEQIGNGTATGNATFLADGTAISTLPLSGGDAVLQVSTSGLPVGTYSMSAKYNGSSTAEASTSAPQSVTLIAGTTTTLTATPNPVESGTATILTANVTETYGQQIPTGTVTFSYQGSVLGTGTLNSSGVATLPLATGGFAAGNYTLTAAYGGDAANGASSGAVTLVVQ